MVSIHRPLGYGPSTLPLRHAASMSMQMVGGRDCKMRKQNQKPVLLRKRSAQ